MGLCLLKTLVFVMAKIKAEQGAFNLQQLEISVQK
jgi:hypothetical protein